jgi:hypothetical protein
MFYGTKVRIVSIACGAAVLGTSMAAIAGPREPGGDGCTAIPIQQSLYTALTDALSAAAPDQAANGGLGNHMWGTIVDRFGVAAQ